MAVRMAKLQRTSSGLWAARKVIPEDLRAAYGKREEKPTWPGYLPQSEAKALFAAWLADVEERIATLRRQARGETVRLTMRQLQALAGKRYQEEVRRWEDDPGSELGWLAAREKLEPEEEDEETYAAQMRGERVEVAYRRVPRIHAEAEEIARREGLALAPESLERLSELLHERYADFCNLMAQRARGDYSPDPLAATIPEWRPPQREEDGPAVPGGGPTLTELFDAYVAERKPAPATVKAWRRLVAAFGTFLGHEDAARVTPEDVLAWKNKLLEPRPDGTSRAAQTVRETYLASLRTVLGYAVENRRLPSNPAAGVTVRSGKRVRLRDPGFTDKEAETILKATLQPQPAGLSPEHALARRWVPWLCAYTGARVGEMTQLRAEDFSQVDGVWAVRITPEAGSVKTNEARVVPLHEQLIDQDLLTMLEGRTGPLFYDPARGRGGQAGNPQSKKVSERLASWVRELGVSDPALQPNHGWRHRFKTEARSANVREDAARAIQGHAARAEDEKYGVNRIEALGRELSKLPRVKLALRPEPS